MFRILAALDAWDRRLFTRLTRRERGAVDTGLERLSNSANRSVLWFAIAAAIAILGGHRGRRAALRGVISIAITSTLVNLPLKYLARRDRPPMRLGDRPLPVSLPGSFSFPSGHSASAFAFATGVAIEEPRLLAPIMPLAAGVAYPAYTCGSTTRSMSLPGSRSERRWGSQVSRLSGSSASGGTRSCRSLRRSARERR